MKTTQEQLNSFTDSFYDVDDGYDKAFFDLIMHVAWVMLVDIRTSHKEIKQALYEVAQEISAEDSEEAGVAMHAMSLAEDIAEMAGEQAAELPDIDSPQYDPGEERRMQIEIAIDLLDDAAIDQDEGNKVRELATLLAYQLADETRQDAADRQAWMHEDSCARAADVKAEMASWHKSGQSSSY